MVIGEISADDALKFSRETLGLPPAAPHPIDDAMLVGSLRRAAGIFCPCSSSTLVKAVQESFRYLADDIEDAAKRIANAVEGLIVIGDLLELSKVATDDPDVKGTWVFAAPPSFVVRSNGSIFILGIVPDENTPLPQSLSARVLYEGYARVLLQGPGEELPSVLRALGLLELSESVWIRTPRQDEAAALCESMAHRLAAQPPSGLIEEVSILDPATKVEYYPGRWISPTRETGTYVARRPQAYGASLWGFASLTNGVVTKFLDFPLKGSRWRGCDDAWYLQMAIDHSSEKPQRYRSAVIQDAVRLDFFSPLPLWAQRRLTILGRPVSPEGCLISYSVPKREIGTEEAFLQERLWLKPVV